MKDRYVKKLTIQLFASIISVLVSFAGLVVSTYAWYVSNVSVTGTTSTISAVADGVVLQINAGKVALHDGDTATVALAEGHGISPASSEDMVNWYVPDVWVDNLSRVKSYIKVELSEDSEGEKDGSYLLGGKVFYAYSVGVYNVFALKNTGHADVYFDGSTEDGPIKVTRAGSDEAVSDKVAASLRVGIVIDDNLAAVYAPATPSGAGNDVNYSGSDAANGWRVVSGTESTSNTTKDASYIKLVSDTQDSWSLKRDENGSFYPPTADSVLVASDVDYNGVVMKVVIWMEGTDADCIGSIVTGDESEYNVTVHLAGIAK